MNFSEVAQEWYDSHMTTMVYDYRLSVKSAISHINFNIGNIEISDIKPRDIDVLISRLSERNPNTGKPSSKRTIKQVIGTASAIFTYAYDNEFINRIPTRGKKPPKNAPRKERRALTAGERELIINTEHRAQVAAMIMMFAGLRRGEVIALKWSDIDYQTHNISVNKSATRSAQNQFMVKQGTKNGKSRNIQIPTILNEFLKDKSSAATSVYVMPTANGNLQTPSSWKRMWESYQVELNYSNYLSIGGNANRFDPHGVPKTIDNITSHMLRHTYATLLFNAGVDVKTASQLLGHSDIKTTLAIYTHLEEEKRVCSISKFEEYIAENF